jgi:hypothetical protein
MVAQAQSSYGRECCRFHRARSTEIEAEPENRHRRWDSEDAGRGRGTRLNKRSMPMLIMSFKAWLNYPDYYFFWTYDGINNSVFDDMNYVNPDMDKLIEAARFEADPTKICRWRERLHQDRFRRRS